MRVVHEVVLAGTLIDQIASKLEEVKGLLLLALSVMAVWWIFKEAAQSHGALSRIAPAIVTVVVVLFCAYNIGWLKDRFTGEVRATAAQTTVVQDSPGTEVRHDRI